MKGDPNELTHLEKKVQGFKTCKYANLILDMNRLTYNTYLYFYIIH